MTTKGKGKPSTWSGILSFSMELVQLAAIMILPKHVPSLERLKNYQFGQCLLDDSSFFSLVTRNLADLMEVLVWQMEDSDSNPLLTTLSVKVQQRMNGKLPTSICISIRPTC
jgi:hypothetical protein